MRIAEYISKIFCCLESHSTAMDTDQPATDQQMFPSPPVPLESILQRLTRFGIPSDYVDKKEAGLVQFFQENRGRLNELVYVLLPSALDVQADCFSQSELFLNECREGVRWVQWLMFEENPAIVLDAIGRVAGGQRGVCGAVWGSNDIAYRCRTCENDPTCAICVPCFLAGEHVNHDYSMIYTGGGCCDCGDITAWKSSGFCSRHRGPGQAPPLAEAVKNSARPVMEALFLVWAKCLQEAERAADQRKPLEWGEQTPQQKVASTISMALSDMLLTFCNCSESMLIFVAALIGSNKVGLLDTLLWTECILPKEVINSLHELLFKLMGDANFKYHFATVFIKYYPRLMQEATRKEIESASNHSSTRNKDTPTLSNFSVQIFTVPTLTPRLVLEFNLLEMLLDTVKEVFLQCVGDDGQLMVSKGPIAAGLYHRVLEDIRFVMSHPEVSQYVARECPDLTKKWLHLVAYTQGMDPQKRATNIHVEEETTNWISAYCLEVQMAGIHLLFVSGATATEHGKMVHQKDTGSDLEENELQERHAKIGRISKECDVVGSFGEDSRGCATPACSLVDNPNNNPLSVSVVVPKALLWLISECMKVLDAWLLVDASRELSRLKQEAGKSTSSSRKGLLLRGKGGRRMRVLLGTGTNENTSDMKGNPGLVGTFREWLCLGRDLMAAGVPLSEDYTGDQSRRHSLQSGKESSELDLADGETSGTREINSLGDLKGWDQWMGLDVDYSGVALDYFCGEKEWPVVGFDVSRQEVSFHIPLHRFLALVLQKSLEYYATDRLENSKRALHVDDSLIEGSNVLLQMLPSNYQVPSISAFLMEHPLRLQVFCAQVRAGMWRRNGHSVLALCDYYRSVRWCEHSHDLDLFLLQCCAAVAPSEELVERIIARFGLTNYFVLILLRPNESEPVLVYEMLMLLIRIVVERGLCGFSEVDALRRELIRRLAISDSTHSQLMKFLPSRLSENKNLQATLDAITSYSKPSGMRQGKYSLRNECWVELDLYHPRWVPRDLQCVEDRYFRARKMSPVLHQLPQWNEPFAPLHSLYKIATTKAVHDILRSVFFHTAFSDKISESRAPENVLITALHLLALGLDICSKIRAQSETIDNRFGDSSSLISAQVPPPLLTLAKEKVNVCGTAGAETPESHCTLSFMVLLMRKYACAEVQSAATAAEMNQCNIADLIKVLLGKFANLDRGCMYEIESLAPEILHRVSTSFGDTQSELQTDEQKKALEADKRKALAREHQAAIMAKMKAAQEKFVASLCQSDESKESGKVRSKDPEKKLKEATTLISTSEVDMSTRVCVFCRESGSRSPLSFLTFVQRSRLVEISEKGIPSWEGVMESRNKDVSARGSVDVGSPSIEDVNTEPPNSVELLNLIQMALNGNMDVERIFETDDSDIFRAGVLESLTNTERVNNDSIYSRMSDSISSDASSDDSTDEHVDDSSTIMLDYLRSCRGKATCVTKDGIKRTRENAMAAVLVEYVTILSRNLKEQQHADNNSKVASGSQNRRSSYLRSSPSLAATSFGVHMSSCGHAVHQECLDRYLCSLLQRYYSRVLYEGHQIVDPDQGEFLCPTCRRIANSVLPVLSTATVCAQTGKMDTPSTSDSQLTGMSAKTMLAREAITLLHNAQELVWKLNFQKAVSKPLLKSTKAAFDSLFSKLHGMYYPCKDNSSKSHVRVSQSLLLWNVFRYTMMAEELASRKSKASLSDSETRLGKLWKAADATKGSILPLLLNAAKATQSQNRQSVLLRARGMQLLVGSICHGASKDSMSGPSIPDNISQVLLLIEKGQESGDMKFWHRTADPVLAHDPFSTLLWVIFCLPLSFPASREPFIAIVHLLYLVCITQAIGFTHTEDSDFSLLDQGFVQSVYKALSSTCLSSMPSENSSSSLSGLPLTIRRLTLPYLRRCALLQRLFFNTADPPFLEEIDAKKTFKRPFGLDEEYLDHENRRLVEAVYEEVTELEQLEYIFSIPPLQDILQDECSRDLILKWCQHLSEEKGSRKFQTVVRAFIPTSPLQLFCRPFQLMKLPSLYQDIIQRYIKEKCPECMTVPGQPALCLLCGRLCCALTQKSCCIANRQSECFRHAMFCGAGIGIFLMIRKTTILLQRCARQAEWPSPYLDAHGEEDINMSRGKHLYLNEERYASLTQLVASHGLDHSSLVLHYTTMETTFWG